MAQYTEGQKLKGSDGNIYVVRNGAPVLASPTPLVQNPAQPLDLRQKGLGIQRTQQEIDLANATAASAAEKARAEARSAEIKARQDQEAYDAAHPKNKNGNGPFGEAFLKTLPPADGQIVRALVEGRLPFPGSFALRSPYWQTKLQQVAQFDPTFDATNYNARAKARASAVAGPLGKANNALNTAVGHLGTLYEQAGETASHGGDNSLFPFATTVNHLENKYLKGSGHSGVTNFVDTASKLADELEAAYRGGNGSEAGVVRQLRNLDVDMSLDQKLGVIRNAVDLLASKMAANAAQYNFGTGGKPSWDMLDPHAKQVLQTIAPGAIDKYFAAPEKLDRRAASQLLTNAPPDYKAAIVPLMGGGGGNGPDDSGPDLTNYGGTSPIPHGGTSRTEPDAQASALIDSLVSQNVPYGEALKQLRKQYPDATPLSPKQYNSALDYHKKHPNETTGYGSAVRTIPLSDWQAFSNALVQSAPGALATRFNDAALGGLPSAVAGDQGQYFHALTSQAQPGASTVGDIGGAVAGTLGIGRGFSALEKGGSPLVKKLLGGPGRRALLADTTYGGTYGATQNPDHPIEGAALGAAAMGAGNAIGSMVLGPALAAAGTTGVGQRALGMFGASAAPKLAPESRMIVSQAGKRAPDILSTLDEAANLNLPYSLADANPQLRALAGSATRKSPVVRELAENTIGPRQLGQADRALSAIDTHLASSGDLSQMKADALTRARAASQPYYEKAMHSPPPDDAALRELLDTPAGQNAAREAYSIALNKGEKPGELSFHTLPDGSVRIDGTPNWRTLQYMKQGIDTLAEKARDPRTGILNLDDPSVRGLQDFRSRFTSRLHTLNPDYAAADNAFAQFAKQGTTAELGAAATARGVTPETAQGTFSNLAPEHQPFYQRGFASSLANKVENAPFSSDPYKLIYGSPAQQAKVRGIFPNGADTFGRINALEGDMGRTAYETLGGSPTAARAQADAAFDHGPADLASDIAFSAATGAPPPRLVMRGLQAGKDMLRLGIGRRKAEQIGPILLDTNPANSSQMLRDMLAADEARRAYMAKARAAGGMFAAPLTAPFISN